MNGMVPEKIAMSKPKSSPPNAAIRLTDIIYEFLIIKIGKRLLQK
jgi:hypothetical protein